MPPGFISLLLESLKNKSVLCHDNPSVPQRFDSRLTEGSKHFRYKRKVAKQLLVKHLTGASSSIPFVYEARITIDPHYTIHMCIFELFVLDTIILPQAPTD